MKGLVILSEGEIVQAIAHLFSVDASEVTLKHYKEPVGYGYSEGTIDRVQVNINIPTDEIIGEDKHE